MGRGRLRGSSQRLKPVSFGRQLLSTVCGGDNRGEEHRSRDCGASDEAIRFYHSRTTGFPRQTRCRGAHAPRVLVSAPRRNELLSGRGDEMSIWRKLIFFVRRVESHRAAKVFAPFAPRSLTGYLISIESCIQRERGERLQPPCHLRPPQQRNA